MGWIKDTLRKNAERKLLNAIEQRNIKAVQKALALGADVNAQMDNSRTVLMNAANNGYKEIVELLIRTGSDVTIKNEQGKMALNIPDSKKYSEIATLLVDAQDYPEKYQKLTEADAERLQQQIKAMSERELLDLPKQDPKLLQKTVLTGKLIETVLPILTPEQQKVLYYNTYNAVSPKTRKTMETIIRNAYLNNCH